MSQLNLSRLSKQFLQREAVFVFPKVFSVLLGIGDHCRLPNAFFLKLLYLLLYVLV